ncbi:tektin-2-like [Macrosteles quadrilineatus]|uniref:tektin-2-like n=1 Tax=Macrosteles quadrilineatus TaxID=74068 RepID=UPI0023E1F744|nr:tektin-2-like [Macrosteles quadrilineatus]XP_054288202.1 tektin-2-like [Macrosteles quadrilineatus]
MMSVVTFEKPISKVALPDWHGKVAELRQTCDSRRADAFSLWNEARQLRNETNCKTQWDTYHNNVRLADRITEVSRWRELIESCLKAIEKEIAELSSEKEITETEIERLNLNFTVVNECLSMRDQRGGADLCRDEGEAELKHELSTLESLKKMLTDKAAAAWEQINRLEEVRFQLQQDLLDKDEALEICRNSLGLDKNCANISYKPNPLRLPNKLISYESWLEHCKYLKLRADNELAAAQKLRESMYVPRERAQNDMKAQNDATNFALRKRIYETQRIKNELDWQRFNILPYMDRLMKEIDNLEQALLDKTNALKLAETRCENRLYRPGAELCRDEPMLGLHDEVCQLRKTQQDLQNKIDAAKATYNMLEDQLMVIDRELYNKNQALTTDLRCLDLRARLSTGGRAEPSTQTDRNIVLTRMQDEIPPEP